MKQANGEKILVVEGEDVTRQHVKDYLAKLGYLVDDVARMEQAVELLRRDRYDAVVLDAGVEPSENSLQDILTISPGMPVIVMSSMPSEKSIIASLRQGAFDYIIKPYEILELGTIVPRAVRLGSTRGSVRAATWMAGVVTPAQ